MEAFYSPIILETKETYDHIYKNMKRFYTKFFSNNDNKLKRDPFTEFYNEYVITNHIAGVSCPRVIYIGQKYFICEEDNLLDIDNIDVYPEIRTLLPKNLLKFVENSFGAYIYILNMKYVDKFQTDKALNKIIKIIEDVKNKSKAIPLPDLSEYYIFDNKYILFKIDSKNRGIVNKDFNISSYVFNGWMEDYNYNFHYELENLKDAPLFLNNKLFLFDIVKWEFASNEILLKEIERLKKDKNYNSQYIEFLRKLYKNLDTYINQKTEIEFMTHLNQYFISKGWSSLVCTSAKISSVEVYERRYNFVEKRENTLDRTVLGYDCKISYNNQPLIDRYSHVYVADDENLTMLVSSWCQRTTRWSKELDGVVDQIYNWNILDWLTGPFFEMKEIIATEAPLVYKGRQSQKAMLKENFRAKLKRALDHDYEDDEEYEDDENYDDEEPEYDKDDEEENDDDEDEEVGNQDDVEKIPF